MISPTKLPAKFLFGLPGPDQAAGNKRQRGVTMLLAILVLSSITAIAFSLATIIFIEIRTSGDVARTEPTLYASVAITEEAIFKVKRSAPDCISPGNPANCLAYDANIGSVTISNPILQLFSTTPLIEIFNPTLKKVYQIVDPNNIFGGANYGQVKVGCLQPLGTAVSVILDQIDPNTGNRVNGYASDVINCATSYTPSFVLIPSQQYEMTIQNQSNATSATVSIDSFAADGSTPQGLPYVGLTVLDITASYSGLTRQYRVKIPEQ